MFPKAIITTIKKAGHWVHSDAPEEMKELVFRFFG
jgi:pimeloyl-ACP methyl ester carboxylesterase